MVCQPKVRRQAGRLTESLPPGTRVLTRVLSILALTSLGLAACAESVGPVPEPMELSVSPLGASLSGVGSTTRFVAAARDADGASLSPTIVWSSLNPNVATVDAATGLATAVASGQATIAATAAGVTAYALVTVTVPGVAPVTSWTATDVHVCVNDLWGASANDVFAAGRHPGAEGRAAVLHWDGVSWTEMDLNSTVEDLWGVSGTSSTDVWVVGDGILHWDGNGWDRMPEDTASHFFRVWAAAPDDVYATSSYGAYHYDGNTWSPTVVEPGFYWAVWGSSSEDVHFMGPGASFRGLWGSSASDVFAASLLGFVFRYDGSGWNPMDTGSTGYFMDVWGASPNDLYVVGDDGLILHFDGATWTSMESGTTDQLWSIWGISSGDVFVGSRCGTILRGTR